jgi:hypothetical protein
MLRAVKAGATGGHIAAPAARGPRMTRSLPEIVGFPAAGPAHNAHDESKDHVGANLLVDCWADGCWSPSATDSGLCAACHAKFTAPVDLGAS